MSEFSELSLAEPLLRALLKDGFETPTPIQARSIPILLSKSDFIGLAETGTGKTAAFLLPLMQHLLDDPQHLQAGKPRSLILVPTRELAQQIIAAVEKFCRHTSLKSSVIFGGAPMHKQVRRLRGGLDILVATPGRLMDHIRQGNVSFDNTEYFILDEADRMLDMGFLPDVKVISSSLPSHHQAVLFSATMNKTVAKLATTLLDNPERVDVTEKIAVSKTILHQVMQIASGKKMKALLHILEENSDKGQYIIFFRTKRGADRLNRELARKGYRTDAIHGDRNQRQRTKTLKKFREGHVDILLATDVAARGIDVPGVAGVINYDLPLEAESYVHRLGRTGRNGAHGVAWSLCTQDDVDLLFEIEKLLQQSVEVFADHPFHTDLKPHHGGTVKRNRGRGAGQRKKSVNGGAKKVSSRQGKKTHSSQKGEHGKKSERAKAGSPSTKQNKNKRYKKKATSPDKSSAKSSVAKKKRPSQSNQNKPADKKSAKRKTETRKQVSAKKGSTSSGKRNMATKTNRNRRKKIKAK